MASTPTDKSSAPAFSLPFKPDESQTRRMPRFRENFVPRYLFRLHAPRTVGTTNTSFVISPAATCGDTHKTRDIFALQPHAAISRLNDHLWWFRHHEDLNDCNFMSWTSSLLFAIQHGLRRHSKDEDRPNLSKIFLLVLDTRGFPDGTFIKDIEIIQAFSPYPESMDMRRDKTLPGMLRLRTIKAFYFGEYLTQGELHIQGRCVETSLQKLVDLGLFELQPELGDKTEWGESANRVVELRKPFDEQSPYTRITSETEVRKAITVAQVCFGDRWALPMAAMLLALKPREKGDTKITNGFSAMFSWKEVDECSLESMDIDADRLPEVKQFQDIIGDIHFSRILDPFKNLGYETCRIESFVYKPTNLMGSRI